MAQDRQRELERFMRQARMAAMVHASRPGWWARVCMRISDILIAGGLVLKRRYAYQTREPDGCRSLSEP